LREKQQRLGGSKQRKGIETTRGLPIEAVAHGGLSCADCEFRVPVVYLAAASLRDSDLGALARLGLARAYALQSNTAKARAAYQDFLTLWKDADPDIPILIAAKSEYAKLQ
jgi:hypothetical protein